MRKIIVMLLIATQAFCLPITAQAEPKTSMSDAEKHLNDTNEKIEKLREQQDTLQEEANELDSELAAILIEEESTKADIEEKNEELDEAKQALKDAEKEEEEHRESMGLRIQYIYENGDTGFLTSIITSGSIADVINRAEFTNSLYKEDRELLNAYIEAKDTADTAREKVEKEKTELEDLEETLNEQQKELEEKIVDKAYEIEDVNERVIELQGLAEKYQATIEDLNAQIRVQEALAAARAAAESVATTTAQTQRTTTQGDEISGAGATTNAEIEEDVVLDEASANAMGQAIADYACQFVGNPYVWGGTSLTNGCDCSGFIMSIYANFGVSLPHYSGALRSVGYEVSESELMPGDIICFSGHCAIYIGNNQIVHAQSSATGIVISSYPYHKTTLARRRIF